MKGIEKGEGYLSANGLGLTNNGNEANLARHTEDLDSIITKVPNWMVRWGIMLFFCILLMAVAISIFVRYPDTIEARLKIESINNAKPVICSEGGIISKLFVKKNEYVKKGQLLASVINSNNPDKSIPLISPQDGKIAFISIVQKGYFLKANQEIFRVTPQNEQFFGIMQLPQNQISKIKEGQLVLIKLNEYPVEDYGYVSGKISYIADEPQRDGLLTIKVTFNNKSDLMHRIKLKSWMTGNAKIITNDISLFSRLIKVIYKKT